MKGPNKQRQLVGKRRKPRGEMPIRTTSKHAKARQQRQQAKQRKP